MKTLLLAMSVMSVFVSAAMSAQTGSTPCYKQPWDASQYPNVGRDLVYGDHGEAGPTPIKNLPDLPPQQGLAMVLNMVTMETFGIRGGRIHQVEAFPFVTFAYGQGDGWTPAEAR